MKTSQTPWNRVDTQSGLSSMDVLLWDKQINSTLVKKSSKKEGKFNQSTKVKAVQLQEVIQILSVFVSIFHWLNVYV